MRLLTALMAATVAAVLAAPAGAQDVARGKQVFEQCAACHSLSDGQNMLGPHLHGLFGRKSASVGDYVYSPPQFRLHLIVRARHSLF